MSRGTCILAVELAVRVDLVDETGIGSAASGGELERQIRAQNRAELTIQDAGGEWSHEAHGDALLAAARTWAHHQLSAHDLVLAGVFRQLQQHLVGDRACGGTPARLPAHSASCRWAPVD